MIQEICFFLRFETRKKFHFPQPNGASERSIRTVQSMLAKIAKEDQKNSDLYIPSSCLTYNTSVHSSTGFTPSFLRFGRELRLPSDFLQLNSHLPSHELHSDYATELKSWLMQAFQTASETVGVASYSEGLLWPQGESRRLSSKEPSPLVRQEIQEG